MTDAPGEVFACGLDTRQIHDRPGAALHKHTCERRYKLVLSAPSTGRPSCTTAVRVSFRG
jgi:hypothetical protein